MNNATTPYLIDLRKIGDDQIGFITVSEVGHNVPFQIKRVYWTYHTPENVVRGNHAHKELNQIIVAVSGELNIKLENRNEESFEFTLDSPNLGLFIPEGYWRTITFSENTVLLCLASEIYLQEDYIRDYNEFKFDS